MALPHFARELSALPEALDQRLAGLTEEQLRFKPGDDAFSMLESICHLRDIEIEGYSARLGRILREDCPRLPDLDGARLARERRYDEQELQPALQALLRARRRNLEIIEKLTETELSREAFLEGTGEITLYGLVTLWVEHDQGHLRELDALLAMLRDPAGLHIHKPFASLT